MRVDKSLRVLALVSFTAALLAVSVSCQSVKHPPPASALQRFEYTRPEMGMPFRIVLYAADKSEADRAAHAAFDRIRELNGILSDYDPDSELSRLSQTAGQGKAVPVSADLWNVLAPAQAFAKRSHGAFDVTVGPLVSLWKKSRRVGQLPSPEVLARARQAVGYEKLRLDPRHHTAQLTVPNMRLDLGGIAKGYALDEAQKVLRAQGIRRALVTGGGDMAASGPPPGKPGWRIEIAPLDVPQAPPRRFVLLANVGLATSGDLFQHADIDGKRYSHIVDPRTGLGLTDHSLVTVIAPDATTADGLSKPVSVFGPREGLKLVEKTKGAAAYGVRQPGPNIETFESKRFKDFCSGD